MCYVLDTFLRASQCKLLLSSSQPQFALSLASYPFSRSLSFSTDASSLFSRFRLHEPQSAITRSQSSSSLLIKVLFSQLLQHQHSLSSFSLYLLKPTALSHISRPFHKLILPHHHINTLFLYPLFSSRLPTSFNCAQPTYPLPLVLLHAQSIHTGGHRAGRCLCSWQRLYRRWCAHGLALPPRQTQLAADEERLPLRRRGVLWWRPLAHVV